MNISIIFIMKLSDNEKRDIVKLLEKNLDLPDKFKFLLFNSISQTELQWVGKSNEFTNVVLPFQTIEHIDEPRSENIKFAQGSFDFASGRQITGWTNKLIWGDNKFVLSSLINGPLRNEIEKEGGIKMIYIDPPFDVGANFNVKINIHNSSYEKKANILEAIAYRDTWGESSDGKDSYLTMFYERIKLLKDLLAEDGSIFVHCDYRLAAKIRILLDEVFGEENFANEIIWQGSAGDTSDKNKKFIKSHDSIFYYRKDKENFIWNDVFQEYSEGGLKPYKFNDEHGKYRFRDCSNPGGGGYIYDLGYGEKVPSRGYSMPKKTALEWIQEGKLVVEKDKVPRVKQYLNEEGTRAKDVWNDLKSLQGPENLGYPTQKPEKLLERIIKCASNQNDIVLDCFAGSGTTAAVAEKLGRKWIVSDLGKFSIHSIRKRMISVQRSLKKDKKNWRSFELLNLGKYQRHHYVYDEETSFSESIEEERYKKDQDFRNLILDAYNAKKISGFNLLHGEKSNVFVSIGPVNQPVVRTYIEEIISECLENNILNVDVLGFEYEMGLFPTIKEEAKTKGLNLSYKQIPVDIFDERVIKEGNVKFYNNAVIEFLPNISKGKISIELIHYKTFYSDNFDSDTDLKLNQKKIVVENGEMFEFKKDSKGEIEKTLITESWHDWIDYWSVDFDYESKKEIIKVENNKKEIEELWSGNYIFENEWQSFRTIKNKGMKLELKTTENEIFKKNFKVAVKVVDIFGNDTMQILEINL